MQDEKDLIQHCSLEAMAHTWEKAKTDITTALRLLAETKKNLEAAFGQYMGFEDRSLERLDVEDTIKHLRRLAWGYVVEKTEIRKILSMKRQREIDKYLEQDSLPEITVEEMANLIKSAYSNAGQFAEELVMEVFEYLRPHDSGYKTNMAFQQALKAKVILPWAVEHSFGGKLQARYGRGDQLRAVDNVFHALDGKGFASTYYGELYDAINATKGQGETEYFRFKGYHNGNLHLEFKRLDLLKKMNAIIKERSLTQHNTQEPV